MGAVSAATFGIDFSNLGPPGFDRRLTDKILAAFNHAYAVGDLEVARRLRDALALAEDHERNRALILTGAQRRGGSAVEQADLWAACVEARNLCQEVCQGGTDSAEARAAIEVMKQAYQRWSSG